jgi:hypothetical protein
MNSQRIRRIIITRRVFVPPSLSNFLNRANFNRILQLHSVQTLTDRSRGGGRLAGIDIVNRNVEREAYRLQIYNRCLINLTTNLIWDFLSPSQRNRFIRLANRVNQQNRMLRIHSIDNTDTLGRIARINNQQITSNYFEQSFFGGTNF